MIRITQLKLPCGHSQDALEEKIRRTLRAGKGGKGGRVIPAIRRRIEAAGGEIR